MTSHSSANVGRVLVSCQTDRPNDGRAKRADRRCASTMGLSLNRAARGTGRRILRQARRRVCTVAHIADQPQAAPSCGSARRGRGLLRSGWCRRDRLTRLTSMGPHEPPHVDLGGRRMLRLRSLQRAHRGCRRWPPPLRPRRPPMRPAARRPLPSCRRGAHVGWDVSLVNSASVRKSKKSPHNLRCAGGRGMSISAFPHRNG